MNSVSFGSTYKIDTTKNFQHQGDIIDFCDKNNVDYGIKTEAQERFNGFRYNNTSKTTATILAPDSKDGLIEAYLANKGIKFDKLNTADLMKKSSINSRIQNPPKYMKLVEVNTEKLEELLSNQDTNIEHCKKDYDNYYKDSVENLIKSGDKLSATSLHIIPTGESAEDTVNYVKTFGADRLNDGQLSIIFNQRTDDPDHCMYFGLKDLGFDKVPVYVDKETFEIGKALELFK